MKSNKTAPENLSHKPIITVDYEDKDSDAGDAKFLSIGQATWTKNLPEEEKEYSSKVWHHTGEKWSRQSEELPLWRVLDLAIILTATIKGKKSTLLGEFVQEPVKCKGLKAFIENNLYLFEPRLNELKRLLE